MKKKISNKLVATLSNASCFQFPKYTTMLINQINQTAQGTRPKVVGQMSELIQAFDGKTLIEWIEWYNTQQPNAVDNATDKIYQQFLKLKAAMELIDKNLIREWVKDLLYTKTYCGLKVQQAIIAFLADLYDDNWRLATKDEESRGIDGYIGNRPIQIKSSTYKTEAHLNELIEVPIVFYEKKNDGLVIEYDEKIFA